MGPIDFSPLLWLIALGFGTAFVALVAVFVPSARSACLWTLGVGWGGIFGWGLLGFGLEVLASWRADRRWKREVAARKKADRLAVRRARCRAATRDFDERG